MNKSRKPLFSVRLKDCRVDTFRAGGKGGQNQNKVESGVRITHPPSGAVGEARDSRDQLRNKRSAFRRMAETRAFKAWVRAEAARIITGKTIDDVVDAEMSPEKLRVEVRNDEGEWIVQ